MLSLLLRRFATLLFIFAITACEPIVTSLPDGIDPVDPIELYSPDVELLPGPQEQLMCSIPVEGNKFSIFPTPTDRHVLCWNLLVDSVYIERTWQNSNHMFVGDWGRIINRPLKDNYYETVCEIGPNPNAVLRQLTLIFRRFNVTKCLVINQAPNDSLKRE